MRKAVRSADFSDPRAVGAFGRNGHASTSLKLAGRGIATAPAAFPGGVGFGFSGCGRAEPSIPFADGMMPQYPIGHDAMPAPGRLRRSPWS